MNPIITAVPWVETGIDPHPCGTSKSTAARPDPGLLTRVGPAAALADAVSPR